jgi:hypothetical protein
VTGSFCLLYKPITTSTQDTEETKVQVDANNAVWLGMCRDA